jgi:hypothetical protein
VNGTHVQPFQDRQRSPSARIQEFVVDIRTPAAMGICLSNRSLGSGSVLQYYVPGWKLGLHTTGRVHTFAARAYP